jgi:hypothetical protein
VTTVGARSGRAERRSAGSDSAGHAATAKRRANELMRAGLRHFDPAVPIPFFCECSDRRCYQPVWLTSTEYDERCGDPSRPLVFRDHDAVPSSALAARTRP